MNVERQQRAELREKRRTAMIEYRKPIYDAYMRGATLRKIGAEYSVSYETVRQIVIAEKRRLEHE